MPWGPAPRAAAGRARAVIARAALRRLPAALALLFVAALSVVAVAAQAVPEAVVESVPGGETGVTALLVGALAFLGKQLLARPSPEAHREALADLRDARARIEGLTDRLHTAETRLAVAEAVTAARGPGPGI